MNTLLLIALAAIVALFVATLALRHLWRVFNRVTDREIEKSMDDFRRREFFGGDPRQGRGRR